MKEILFIKNKVEQLNIAWKLGTTPIMYIFEELTKEGREYLGKFISDLDLYQFFPTERRENLLPFLAFIKRISALPASEAAAERIFAEMRELYSEKCTNLHPETLRSELIINYNGKLKDK